jgi:hypothetical protein
MPHMKRTIIAAIALLYSVIAPAQPVSGEYVYNISGAQVPVYDLQPGFPEDVGGITENFTIALSPRGLLSGTFTAHYEESGMVIDLDGLLNGKLSSAKGGYAILFGGRGTMTGSVYGQPISGTESFSVRAYGDMESGVATGTEHISVCVSGRGCQKSSEPFSGQLSELLEGDGTWTLTLNLTNETKQITGVAEAKLSSGQTASFAVRGKYSPKSGLSQFQLRGTGTATGVSLRLTTDSAMQLQSMRGKLFGQSADMVVAVP